MRVRYTGEKTTFIALGREVERDEEFDIPDENADSYLMRSDVQGVPAPKPKKQTPPADPAPAPQAPDNAAS